MPYFLSLKEEEKSPEEKLRGDALLEGNGNSNSAGKGFLEAFGSRVGSIGSSGFLERIAFNTRGSITNYRSLLLETIFPLYLYRPGTNNSLSRSILRITLYLFIYGLPSIISCYRGAINIGYILSR